jgi:hypothetical protein
MKTKHPPARAKNADHAHGTLGTPGFKPAARGHNPRAAAKEALDRHPKPVPKKRP